MNISDFRASQQMRKYIDSIFDSGQISYGPYSQEFERRFADMHNCRYGILSNSGTSSLLVALQTLKELHNWPDGSEVIVPAITFVATVNVVLQAGLNPVLIDVEKNYYGIDTRKIARQITDQTRCIIPVHTFGQPCNMTVVDVFKERDIKFIEDSCEAVFVKHYDKPVGSWSDIACFSFYMAHLVQAGVGGLATTDNPDYAKTMRSLVNHGMSYDDLSESDNFNPYRVGRNFVFDRIGHSFRITEFEAALGLAQLDTLQYQIITRQKNASYLSQGLREYEDILQLPAIRPHTEHAFMMYPIVCLSDGLRDNLCRFLNERGIGTRRMLPLISQPCYKGLWNPDDYPVARWIDDNGYYIGCHQRMTKIDLDYVIQAHKDFLSGY